MKIKFLFGLLLIVAFFLRFWRLDNIPPSLDWDEASLGWNAYKISQNLSDEYGVFMPITAIRSFDDYKPPMYVYLTAPLIKVLGLNEMSVRLLSAMSGTVFVSLMGFFAGIVCSQSSRFNWRLGLLTTAIAAVSPWNIQFSRAAFEANLAQTIFLATLICLIGFVRYGQGILLLFAALLAGLSIYSYHSFRLLMPLVLFSTFIIYCSRFQKNKRITLLHLSIFILMLAPIVVNTIRFATVQSRFNSVSIFTSTGLHDWSREIFDKESAYAKQDASNFFEKNLFHNKVLIYGTIFIKNYFDHLNFNFLFTNADGNGRHHAPDWGLLYLWELITVTGGVIFLISRRTNLRNYIFVILLLTPIASSLTTDSPHAIRAYPMLIPLLIFSAYGIHSMSKLFSHKKFIFPTIFTSIFICSLFLYLNRYFIHFPREYASSWQYGYKQVVQKVSLVKNKYKKILVTLTYDQPYIYFLFYDNEYRSLLNSGELNKKIDNIEFVNFGQMTDDFKRHLPKDYLIVMADSDSMPPINKIDEIKFPNGKTAFIIGTL